MQDGAPADLAKRALSGTAKFLLALALLVLVPAGSVSYWQGWLFLANFSLWTVAITLHFLRRDPALIARRLQSGPAAEQEPAQKRIQLFTSIVVGVVVAVSALDHRFGWSAIPMSGVIAGNALIAAGYLIVFLVFRANSFASAIIEVGAGQKVVSTGPYGLVRHPMYAGALVMFAGIPLALGSWWGLAPVVLLAAGLVARLRDEERYLARNLAGYADYCAKVRYRLVPAVW